MLEIINCLKNSQNNCQKIKKIEKTSVVMCETCTILGIAVIFQDHT